jgi:hypothetical protein
MARRADWRRETAMPVRTIQAVIIARRARLKRIAVSAHTLRDISALPRNADSINSKASVAPRSSM